MISRPRFSYIAVTLAVMAQAAFAAQTEPFTSTYTNLATDCKEEGKAQDGQDATLRCKGPDGYSLAVFFSANSGHVIIEKKAIQFTSEAITLANTDKGKIEWRHANGKPFAVIVRSSERDEMGKAGAERLVVRGLKGFESLNESVSVPKNPKANEEARAIADQAHAKRTK